MKVKSTARETIRLNPSSKKKEKGFKSAYFLVFFFFLVLIAKINAAIIQFFWKICENSKEMKVENKVLQQFPSSILVQYIS